MMLLLPVAAVLMQVPLLTAMLSGGFAVVMMRLNGYAR